MSKFKDLTGQRFGKLVVIERYGSHKGHSQWKCKCDCGNYSIVTTGNLNSGHSKTCGCSYYESKNIKHGLRHTRLYGVWLNIKRRCYLETKPDYERYGGRGIKMCDDWKNDFASFYEWAYKNGYDENASYMECTLDRINTDKDYSPDNCRWVSNKVQQNNKRNNIILSYKGETKTLSIWAEELDLPYKTLYSRLKYRKWSVEEAFERPIGNNGGTRRVLHNKGTH